MRGLKGSDGPCVAAHSRSTTRQLGRGGLPPSLAPLVRNPFTPPCHYHPFILCIVGRGLDPSAAFQSTAVNGPSVGEGFIPPAHLPPPPTSAAACGQAALRAPFVVRSVGRSLAPPRGVGDAAPYSGNPQVFLPPPTLPAAWGQAALHPTLPHSVGAGHARPAASPLPPAYLLHRREGS